MKIYVVSYFFDEAGEYPRNGTERAFNNKDDAEKFANQLEKNLAEEYELRYDDDNDEWIDTNTNDVADFHVDVEEVELA